MQHARYLTNTVHKLCYGPGGPKCPCCQPHVHKDKLNRFVRRKLKQELKQLLSSE